MSSLNQKREDLIITNKDLSINIKIKAISDSTRREILGMLYARGPLFYSELARHIGVKLNQLAYHVGLLKRAGYIRNIREKTRKGRAFSRYCITKKGVELLERIGARLPLDTEAVKIFRSQTADLRPHISSPDYFPLEDLRTVTVTEDHLTTSPIATQLSKLENTIEELKNEVSNLKANIPASIRKEVDRCFEGVQTELERLKTETYTEKEITTFSIGHSLEKKFRLTEIEKSNRIKVFPEFDLTQAILSSKTLPALTYEFPESLTKMKKAEAYPPLVSKKRIW